MYAMLFYAIFMISCGSDEAKRRNEKDLNTSIKKSDLDSKEDSLLNNQNIEFKNWVKDTIVHLNSNNAAVIEIGQKARDLSISKDSLSFTIKYTIEEVVKPPMKFPSNSILGGTIYMMRGNNIKLPSTPFVINIVFSYYYDALEYYDTLHKKRYTSDYEYLLLTIYRLNSDTETVYKFTKGNLTYKTERLKKRN